MRLKKLEVVGFKSFLEKATFDFTASVSGVVGPNGCGKSNVVDAIKWVTGELSFKELRGRSTQDLIFSGSELRPPTSMAEVALTLDNSDGLAAPPYNTYPEIQVIRRVFRDGTSEYFINKTPCRLRDVVDVFLDTGVGQSSYSIIEQGRVGMLVASKPEDRRIIIEEAAGITKFKHRKKAAERKMEYTRQNLLRVTDIIGELKRQIGSLERQAKKAEKYKELSTQARELDLSVSSTTYLRFKADLDELESGSTTLAMEQEQLQTELTVGEAGLEELKVLQSEIEQNLQTSQMGWMEENRRLSEVDQKRMTLKHESELLKENTIRERERAQGIETETAALSLELSACHDRQAISVTEKSAVDEQLKATFIQESNLSVILRDLESVDHQQKISLLDLLTKEAELKNQIQNFGTRRQDVQLRMEIRAREVERARQELRELEAEYTARQRDLGMVVQLRFGFEREQDDTRGRLSQLFDDKATQEQELSLINQKIEGHKARLQTLEEFQKTYQAYGEGTRSIMNRMKEEPESVGKILGLMGELVRPKRGFERAVEAVLRDRISSLVVEEPRDAMLAIEYLKSGQKGRSSFWPLLSTRLRREDSLPTHSGVEGWLRDFVDFSGDRRSHFQSLLENVIVVESLPRALALWEDGVRQTMVTREGDLITPEGQISGGSWGTSEQGVLEVYRDIEELREEQTALEGRREYTSRLLERTKKQISATEAELNRVESALVQESQKAIAHEKDFERLEEALRRLKSSLEVILKEDQVLKDELSALDAQELETGELLQTNETSRTSLQEETKIISERIASTKEMLVAQVQVTTEQKVRLASLTEQLAALDREHLALTTRIESLQNERKKLLASADENELRAQHALNQLQELEQVAQEATLRVKELEQVVATLRTSYDEKALHVQAKSEEIKKYRESLSQTQSKLHETQMRLQEEKMRLDYLVTQTLEKYQVMLSEWVKSEGYSSLDEATFQGAQEHLAELRERMTKIGDVHLGAIDELKELAERHEFLTKQKEDLEQSLDSLTSAIKKINTTTRERFEEAFRDVDQKFQELFPRLFRGGKARLMLTDPENLLETGVEIMAQPPGKKLQNLNLLSGGEKALTAIALLFSLFLHKAPPFCLLDEVDAPLDDHNVRRYLGLVQEMSTNTQFVLITHNKLSMEIAQNLFGITMEEPGVSRVVSVKVKGREAVQLQPEVAAPISLAQ